MNLLKQALIILLFLASVNYVQGQGKIISISNDDTMWHKRDAAIAGKIGLTDLTLTHDGTHWRFWYTKYIAGAFAIDISSTDSLNCKAFITTYTFGSSSLEPVYHERTEVSPSIAAQLFKQIRKIELSKFSRRDTVNGGRSTVVYETLDSAPYMIEYADNKHYLFKSAGRPGSLQECKDFFHIADTLVDFGKINTEFEKNIPLAMYSSDRWQFKKKNLTARQKKEYKRYWKEHAM